MNTISGEKQRVRSAGALVLLVLLLGVLTAPVADAWAHAEAGPSGPAHAWGDDCGLCRVAATPVVEGSGFSDLHQLGVSIESAPAPVSGHQVAAPRPLTFEPPPRGPPA